MHTNGGLKTFTKIAPLKLISLGVHIKEYSTAKFSSLKDVTSIPSVYIAMESSKERAIIVENGENQWSLLS